MDYVVDPNLSNFTNDIGFLTTEIDGSVTNEKISALMIMGDSLSITEGAMTIKVSVDSSNTNELQTVSIVGDSLMLSAGGGSVAVDSSNTNEKISSFMIMGDSLAVTEGGMTMKVALSLTYTIGLNNNLGGYVFYVTPDGKHGLVAATQDQGFINWYAAQDLINNPANHNTAGKNFTNWRIPTRYELNLMYIARVAIGGFSNDYYWSSTEVNNFNDAWGQDFDGGFQFNFDKDIFSLGVRCIRAF